MFYRTELKHVIFALRNRTYCAIATSTRGAVTHNYGYTDIAALRRLRK